MLGYTNARKALGDHVDSDDKRIIQRSEITTIENHIPKSAFPVNFVPADIPNRGLTIINESGLYSLILSSKRPGSNPGPFLYSSIMISIPWKWATFKSFWKFAELARFIRV